MKFKMLAVTALSSLAFLPLHHSANAAGFYIQEQSVKGLGSAFSGSTTSLDDASTVYFNPAGMTKLDRAQVNAGVHLIIPDTNISNTGTTAPPGVPVGFESENPIGPTPVPNAYGVLPLNHDLWVGFGVSAPFGLGSEYDSDFFGRFDSTDTELKTINIGASLAYKATDWLSVGLGLDIQHADANLQSNLFAGTVGTSRLEGDDWSYGYNAGVQIKPLPSTEFGLHYRSAIRHTLDGTISAEGTGGADFRTEGEADLNLPDIATFGVAHQLTPKTRLMGQATWFGWNSFQDITAISDAGTTISSVTQNYQTTWAFAVGAEHDWNDKLTLRVGYQYDETPTTDEFRTSRTPDGDRNWFAAGATYKFNDHIDLDFAATFIDVGNEEINVSRNGGLANFSADTKGEVSIISMGLNYKF